MLTPELAICFVHPGSMDPICTLGIPAMSRSQLAVLSLLLLLFGLVLLRARRLTSGAAGASW